MMPPNKSKSHGLDTLSFQSTSLISPLLIFTRSQNRQYKLSQGQWNVLFSVLHVHRSKTRSDWKRTKDASSLPRFMLLFVVACLWLDVKKSKTGPTNKTAYNVQVRQAYNIWCGTRRVSIFVIYIQASCCLVVRACRIWDANEPASRQQVKYSGTLFYRMKFWQEKTYYFRLLTVKQSFQAVATLWFSNSCEINQPLQVHSDTEMLSNHSDFCVNLTNLSRFPYFDQKRFSASEDPRAKGRKLRQVFKIQSKNI